MWIVIFFNGTGDVISCYGPFKTEAAAVRWGARHYNVNETWRVQMLQDPAVVG